jgi:hypothetical protein
MKFDVGNWEQRLQQIFQLFFHRRRPFQNNANPAGSPTFICPKSAMKRFSPGYLFGRNEGVRAICRNSN